MTRDIGVTRINVLTPISVLVAQLQHLYMNRAVVLTFFDPGISVKRHIPLHTPVIFADTLVLAFMNVVTEP